MSFEPLNDRVLIEPGKAEEKTAGGIYIPDTAKEKSQEGTVIAVGPEAKGLKKGDKVIFESFAASEITLQGKKHVILKAKDVLGIIK